MNLTQHLIKNNIIAKQISKFLTFNLVECMKNAKDNPFWQV